MMKKTEFRTPPCPLSEKIFSENKNDFDRVEHTKTPERNPRGFTKTLRRYSKHELESPAKSLESPRIPRKRRYTLEILWDTGDLTEVNIRETEKELLEQYGTLFLIMKYSLKGHPDARPVSFQIWDEAS